MTCAELAVLSLPKCRSIERPQKKYKTSLRPSLLCVLCEKIKTYAELRRTELAEVPKCRSIKIKIEIKTPDTLPHVFTDQMHRQLTLSFPPKRIISLVPSQTELLCYLGVEKELLGLTKFCIHPSRIQSTKHIVGGTKNLQLDKIAALQPDLIIGNKEENQQEQIEALMKDFPVWMSDIYTLDDALGMIGAIGQICDKQAAATQLQSAIQSQFAALHTTEPPLSAAYLIWRKPYMVAAGGTFINDMMQRAGLVNVFANESRYPQKTAAELLAAQPEVILLSSEPYPFKSKHIAELQHICPQAYIKLVDGELFSWYGNRLLYSASYFVNLRQEIYRS